MSTVQRRSNRARLTRLLLGAALLPLLLASAQGQIGYIKPAPVKAKPAPTNTSGLEPNQSLLLADQVVYDSDAQTVSAVGHVEMDDPDYILHADNVTYDQKTDTVTASGHVVTTDKLGNVAFSDHVVLTNRMRDGALNGFGALIGKNGRLAAASAQRVNGTIVIADHTNYSACKICNQPGQRTPVWQVKAERVVYDQTKHRIQFTDATVDFLGVPFFYTPYLSEPDPTVRYASGLLAPDVGTLSKLGYFARVPVYIALSNTQDLTLQPEFTTMGGDMLEGEYRERWNNSGMWLQASDTYNPSGGLGATGAQNYDHLFGSGRFMVTDSWRTGFDTQLTNNSGYMRLYDISNLDRLINDLFVENDSGRSRFDLASYYFQGLRSTDIQSRIPYALPLLDYSYIPMQNVLGGQFQFNLSGVALSRGSGFDDQRLTGETSWKIPFIIGDGQIWTFTLDGRGDTYRFETPTLASAPASNTNVSRGTGYAELDWRWPFVSTGAANQSFLLEPIAQVIAQPYGGNPAQLLLRDEDSNDFEFDENDIFSANQLPGNDLLESGPRSNVGLRADAMFIGGEAEAILGQTYRLKPDPIFQAGSGETGTASDIVGRMSIKFPNLNFTDRFDFDRGDGTLRRHEIYVTGTYGRSELQISYVELPAQVALNLPNREEINAQSDVNFYANWQAFVAIRRDLLANEFLDTEYGLGYEDECLAISLAYRRKYTFDTQLGVPPSTSVILRFSLKTGDQAIEPFSLFPQDVFTSTHP